MAIMTAMYKKMIAQSSQVKDIFTVVVSIAVRSPPRSNSGLCKNAGTHYTTKFALLHRRAEDAVCQHLAGNFPRSRRIDLEPSLTVGWEWLATHSCPFEHR
jgi:hypothetical protein